METTDGNGAGLLLPLPRQIIEAAPPGLLGWALGCVGNPTSFPPKKEEERKWILLPTEKLSGLSWGDGSSSRLKYYDGEAWQPAGSLLWTSEAQGQLKKCDSRETGEASEEEEEEENSPLVLASAICLQPWPGRGGHSRGRDRLGGVGVSVAMHKGSYWH